MEEYFAQLKRKIEPIISEYGIRRMALFGSSARGDVGKDSDIDILVDIGKDISLLDFVGLKLEMEEALGSKVDLVEYDAIKPQLRDKILSEQVVIL